MTGDLISREALLEFARNHVGHMIDCNDIARFPAVDAAPVVHSSWVYSAEHGSKAVHVSCRMICRNCGQEVRRLDGERHNFCFHCGAKMDEEA